MPVDAFLFGFITACLMLLVILFMFLSRSESNHSVQPSNSEFLQLQLEQQQVQNLLTEQRLVEKRQQVEALELQERAGHLSSILGSHKALSIRGESS